MLSVLGNSLSVLSKLLASVDKDEKSSDIEKSPTTENNAPLRLTPGSDDLATVTKVKTMVEGIIERQPSTYDTSIVVVLRTLVVNGQPTLAILSSSEKYDKELEEVIEASNELNIHGLGVGVKTRKQLYDLGTNAKIAELKAGQHSLRSWGEESTRNFTKPEISRVWAGVGEGIEFPVAEGAR
jgi:hypothetical protein